MKLKTGAVVRIIMLTVAWMSVAAGVTRAQESSWVPYRNVRLTAVQQAEHLANSQIHLSAADAAVIDEDLLTPATTPSHQVLRAPKKTSTKTSAGKSKFGFPTWKSSKTDSPTELLPAPPLHGAHHQYRRKHSIHSPTQPQAAMIPNAKESGVWKQPYSYGYFGASGTRQWTKNYGYRDRKTEWRYR